MRIILANISYINWTLDLGIQLWFAFFILS